VWLSNSSAISSPPADTTSGDQGKPLRRS
jgi:hypothetical protein